MLPNISLSPYQENDCMEEKTYLVNTFMRIKEIHQWFEDEDRRVGQTIACWKVRRKKWIYNLFDNDLESVFNIFNS